MPNRFVHLQEHDIGHEDNAHFIFGAIRSNQELVEFLNDAIGIAHKIGFFQGFPATRHARASGEIGTGLHTTVFIHTHDADLGKDINDVLFDFRAFRVDINLLAVVKSEKTDALHHAGLIQGLVYTL